IDGSVRSARHLDGIGDAETEKLAAPARLRAALGKARAVSRGEGPLHDLREIPAVVREYEPRLEGPPGGPALVSSAAAERFIVEAEDLKITVLPRNSVLWPFRP